MLGNFGFSHNIGFLYLLMLMIPNLFWLKNKPKNYTPKGENKLLCIFERVGEVSTTTCMIFFNNYNISSFNNWTYLLLVSFILIIENIDLLARKGYSIYC